MIEGINILAQSEIVKTPTWCVGLLIIVLAILILSVLSMEVSKTFNNDICFIISGLILLASIIGLIVSIVMCDIKEEPTGEYTYKVTIDDSVSMTEFYEKYKVINTEGQIWTIREKNTDQ